MPDSPMVGRLYCPDCDPDADPSTEILDVLWCETHRPASGGADDAIVSASGYLSGSSEAGGEDNRQWCQMFHRERTTL